MFGLSDCLTVIIQACGTHLDFRHRCNAGRTAVMAAEEQQHQACVDILTQAAQGSPGLLLQQPSASLQQPQTASGSASGPLPLSQQLLQLSQARQQQQHQLQQHQQHQQEASGVMPGLYPLLSNMQGHTDAMLQLTMQAANLYPFQHLPPVLSAPALSRPMGTPAGPAGAPPGLEGPHMAASQRASTESAYTAGRPSLDDASMLSRLYPSSSLDSSLDQNRMSMEERSQRMSTSSRPSSVSAVLCHATLCSAVVCSAGLAFALSCSCRLYCALFQANMGTCILSSLHPPRATAIAMTKH